ncbi:hypothetical protein INT44_006195 [Umbelopsis vinacea]|uniref:Uncharacterized protein n=1 Tax=Umbelopsis vinacea TaxID=44442 RepID=A0A8H7PT13_9FUNG|nr:hypothetical protein INT44_006195 [Umbelopsis vinacea]
MDDLVDYLTLQHVDTVLNISVTAILTVILVLQLLVRRGPVKLHYYFLLAANVFALISSAINEALYNTDTDTTAPGFAMVILFYMSEAFFCLTAAMALRQFTVSYLGGPTFVVTAMCSLAVAASLGFIIVSGFYGQALSTPSSVKHIEILFEADLWTTFAVWQGATQREQEHNHQNIRPTFIVHRHDLRV